MLVFQVEVAPEVCIHERLLVEIQLKGVLQGSGRYFFDIHLHVRTGAVAHSTRHLLREFLHLPMVGQLLHKEPVVERRPHA